MVVLGGGAISSERGTLVIRLGSPVCGLTGFYRGWWLHPTPHTPHPTPHTPHPAPHTLHPTPYTLHPTPYTTPYTLHLYLCFASLQCFPVYAKFTDVAFLRQKKPPGLSRAQLHWGFRVFGSPRNRKPGSKPRIRPGLSSLSRADYSDVKPYLSILLHPKP